MKPAHTLAKLIGHADLKTTQRYVHLSKQHLEKRKSAWKILAN
jgi:site-specific recombinase XerD